MKARTVLVSLLAFALLWLFLRGTDLKAVWTHVQNANVKYVLAAIVFVPLTYVTRAIRWHYLLLPVGPTRFRTAFRTTIIGFAALTLLPARVGDILRPYLLARQEGLDPPATFATVVAERVLDLMAVLTLLAIFVWGFADPATSPAAALASVKVSATIAGAVTLVLIGLMWVLATHPERIGSLVLAVGRVLPRRTAERLAHAARVFSSGFAASKQPRNFVLAIIWSFPIWLAIAAESWLVTRGFGMALPFPGSFLLQALLVLGVAVPTPAGVGSYHAAYRYGMTTFFGAAENQAVAAGLVLHAISFFPVVVIGLVFMVQDGLSLGGLRDLATEAREKELPHADEVSILRESGR
jgi:glycosyltransferase 2 family protein